jgi:hypothetical protein
LTPSSCGLYVPGVTPEIANRMEPIEMPEQLKVVATYPMATLKRASIAELLICALIPNKQ